MQIVDIIKISVSWIIAALPGLKQLLDIFKGGLESTKIAKEIFQTGNEAVQAATSHDESTHLQRAQAASELLRSFAWFGAIEAGFRLGMAAMIIWLFKEAVNAMNTTRKRQAEVGTCHAR